MHDQVAGGHHHHPRHGLTQAHRIAAFSWRDTDRRQIHRLGRRRFVADLGKGTFAIAILGVAACSSEPSRSSTSSATAAAAPTSPPGPAATAIADPSGTPGAERTEAADDGSDEAADAGDSLAWEQVSLGFVSAYVLVRGNTAAIADSGTPGSSDAIGASLATLGVTYDDVEHIVLTHAHGDHVGGLPELIELAGTATVYAGGADIPSITSSAQIQAIGDDDDVFGLQVFNTPGHTPGSISLFDPGIGLLVAGDAINTNEAGTEVTGANERFSTNMDLANASAVRLAGLAPDSLVVGHGNPIRSGAAALLDDLAATIG